MTISEAITLVDKLKPNQYSEEVKIKWLSKLDGQIFREIFQTHEESPIDSFDGYDESAGAVGATELLVPYPYDEDIYNYFLQAQMDKENGETFKYNQSITMYNNAFLTFQSYWTRTRMPKPRTKPQYFKF